MRVYKCRNRKEKTNTIIIKCKNDTIANRKIIKEEPTEHIIKTQQTHIHKSIHVYTHSLACAQKSKIFLNVHSSDNCKMKKP